MIPKIMYFYWNDTKMSWMRYMTLYSFRKLNPDWEMILCLSKNNMKTKGWSSVEQQDYFSYNGIDYTDKISELNIKIENVEFSDEYKDKFDIISPVHESDLYRYYKLYSSGGFYSDMDVIYFRPMKDFYNNVIESNSDIVLYQCNEYVAIGFLGSSKGNQFYKDLLDYAINMNGQNDYQSYGVDLIYSMFNRRRGNGYILDQMTMKYKNSIIYNIPTNLIYEYDWTKIEYVFSNPIYMNKFDKEAIGYHWYGGSSISQNWNNILNEDNFREHKITFSVLAKSILSEKKK